MRKLPTWFLSFLLGTLFLSCSGGGGGGAAAIVETPAPRELRIVPGKNFDEIVLSWTPGSASVDGYELQGRQGSGEFQALHDSLLSKAVTSVTLSFRSDVPECLDFEFRIRAKKDTVFSSFSLFTPYRRGLKPLNGVGAVLEKNGIRIFWTTDSALFANVLVERSGDDGTSWTALPFVGHVFETLDQDIPEGLRCLYRATLIRDGDRTTKLAWDSIVAPVRAPTDLQVSVTGASVRLTWNNRSIAATAVAVFQSSPNLDAYATRIAWLPANATSLDIPFLPDGYYTFSVEATGSSFPPSRTDWSTAAVVTRPPGSLFSRSLALLPSGAVLYVPSWEREWAFFRVESGSSVVYRPHSGGWEAHEIAPIHYPEFYEPYFALDSQKHPHVFYLQPPPSGSKASPVIHEWFDGTTWQKDLVATRELIDGSLTTHITGCIGPNGTPHILLHLEQGTLLQAWEYGWKDAGGWHLERIEATVPGGEPYQLQLHVDGLGVPHLIGQGAAEFYGWPLNEFRHYWRTSTGSWNHEVIPTADIIPSRFSDYGTVLFDQNNLAIAFEADSTFQFFSNKLVVVRKLNGQWGLPAVLGHRTHFGFGRQLAFAAESTSRDLSVLYFSETGIQVHHFSRGSWTQTLLPPEKVRYFGHGFSPGGAPTFILNSNFYPSQSPTSHTVFQRTP